MESVHTNICLHLIDSLTDNGYVAEAIKACDFFILYALLEYAGAVKDAKNFYSVNEK